MRAFVVGGALIGLAAITTPAAAQVEVGLDAGLFSSYVWRGVTYTNKPVLQPDAWVSIPLGNASLTGGVWGNVDIGKYDDANDDLSESGGTSSFNLAEWDWYGEIAVPVGKATLTGGATGYLFPNKNCGACFTKASNTVEVYGKVELDVPLAPSLSAYYDVDKVKGLYLEGSVSHSLQVGPSFSLDLGALAGLSAGQEQDSDASYNFADGGITHIDLSASTTFSAGPLSFTPSLHGVIGLDDATKVTKPSATDTGFKVWGGISVSWSKVLGGAAEEE